MAQSCTSYLSLGSNLNNKLENLQNAVIQINKSIGNTISVSKVYSTPSWGFEGEDFFNICLKINTALTPEQLLEKLLTLEKELGRKAKTTSGYEDRCIDIDIILYENKTINTETLSIPHPRAEQRKFVLLPLKDIYDENHHPFNSTSLSKNIENCLDQSTITVVKNRSIIC